MKNNFNDINCQFLFDVNTKEKEIDALNFAIKYNIDLDLYFGSVTSEFVELCHKNDIKINVWTVDKKTDAESLIKMGVDYITSNILE